MSYFLHEEDELYDLCEQHFGGKQAEPEEKVYTDYSLAVQSAAPIQSGAAQPRRPSPLSRRRRRGRMCLRSPRQGSREEGAEPVVQQGGQPMQAESRPFQSRLRKFSVKIDKTTALNSAKKYGRALQKALIFLGK